MVPEWSCFGTLFFFSADFQPHIDGTPSMEIILEVKCICWIQQGDVKIVHKAF